MFALSYFMYVFVLNVLSSEFSLNENFHYYFAHTEFLSVNFGKGKIHLGELFFFIIIYVPFFVREKFSLVFSKLKI